MVFRRASYSASAADGLIKAASTAWRAFDKVDPPVVACRSVKCQRVVQQSITRPGFAAVIGDHCLNEACVAQAGIVALRCEPSTASGQVAVALRVARTAVRLPPPPAPRAGSMFGKFQAAVVAINARARAVSRCREYQAPSHRCRTVAAFAGPRKLVRFSAVNSASVMTMSRQSQRPAATSTALLIEYTTPSGPISVGCTLGPRRCSCVSAARVHSRPKSHRYSSRLRCSSAPSA